ncbi:AAA family ATPase [Hydrogenophaga sp. MI9]|uniref:AAA family ATPase n=1 Tax=Hydrogenophaga sp. MI9 TaxID=3453719 RepID=UPI003EEB8C1B
MKATDIRASFAGYLGLQVLALLVLLAGLHFGASHPWSSLLASGNLFRLVLILAMGAIGTYIALKLSAVIDARNAVRAGSTVRPIQIAADEEDDPDQQDPVQACLDRLDRMTGLQAVKDEVRAVVARIQVEQRRAEAGLSVTAMSQHMVFSGSPGVGKTEVARILGDIFKALKLVRKGHVVEVDRAALVAGYVGQTAIKTQEKCKEALDGVLFIDEAYTLASDAQGGQGFGQESIDTLLKFMEDNRSRIVVIAAGYPREMELFIHSNPGLASRFTKQLHFTNYSEDELLDILASMAASQQFTLPQGYKDLVRPWLDSRVNDRSWANAREMRTLLERAREEQALRIASSPNASLTEISDADITAALERSRAYA